jgi:hypothetical protein
MREAKIRRRHLTATVIRRGATGVTDARGWSSCFEDRCGSTLRSRTEHGAEHGDAWVGELTLIAVMAAFVFAACGASDTTASGSPMAIGGASPASRGDIQVVHHFRNMTQREGWISTTLDVYVTQPRRKGHPFRVMLRSRPSTTFLQTETQDDKGES